MLIGPGSATLKDENVRPRVRSEAVHVSEAWGRKIRQLNHIMPENLPPPSGELYRVSLPGGLIGSDDGRPNRPGSGVLRRVKFGGFFELGSFSTSLSLYYRAVVELGQINISRTLLGYVQGIMARGYPAEVLDDCVRRDLKNLHSYCYANLHKNKGYALLMHLHALGGPSSHTKDQIAEDVQSWVVGEIDNMPRQFVERKMDQFFANWPTRQGCLTFEEYGSDYLRWATTGGGPKSVYGGEVYRSKWAYCLNNTISSGRFVKKNIYEMSLAGRQVASVALKEEATKTREIISTPLSSYIRQCYLLFRRSGKPPVNSPISSPTWLSDFFSKTYAWYGSVDGDRFDHHVPKWVVLRFVRCLGFDDETRSVAEVECGHLEELHLELFGNLIPFEHGLLSGWRITSVLGTFVSWLAGEWIKEQSGMHFEFGALGDDLILFSNLYELPLERLCALYESFGIPTNPNKSISAPIGEFLRKILSGDGVLGYPALGLKSCVYSAAWLEKYQLESEQEVSVGWLTFLSRLLPHRVQNSNIVLYVLSAIFHQLKMRIADFIRWICTPISVGGGGTMEFSRPESWLALERVNADVLGKEKRLFWAFGVKSKRDKVELVSKKSFKVVDLTVAMKWKEMIRRNGSAFLVDNRLPSDVNLTETLFSWYFSDWGISALLDSVRRHVPRLLRIGDKLNVLLYFMGMVDKSVSLSTLSHSGEQVASVLAKYSYVMNSVLYRRRNVVSMLYLAAGSVLYLSDVLRNERAVYCTW